MDASSEHEHTKKNNLKQELRQLKAEYSELSDRLNGNVKKPLSELRQLIMQEL